MDGRPALLPRVDALPLIADVDAALTALLRDLDGGDWRRPAVKAWSVRDVAAHLLDGNLRRLSLDRDGWTTSDAPRGPGFEPLVELLNRWNAEWVRAAERLSPRVLIELLDATNTAVREYFATLAPEDAARFPVAWAGQDASFVWMDVAREYTEKWHHQQQIRDAVGRPGLKEPGFLRPLLATFARALPRSYEAFAAPPGTSVLLTVIDLDRTSFLVLRESDAWRLYDGAGAPNATARIRIGSETAWRFLTKGIDADAARAASECSGDRRLVEPFFSSVAVMG